MPKIYVNIIKNLVTNKIIYYLNIIFTFLSVSVTTQFSSGINPDAFSCIHVAFCGMTDAIGRTDCETSFNPAPTNVHSG